MSNTSTAASITSNKENTVVPMHQLESRLRQLIETELACPETYFSLGLICKTSNRPEEAAQCFATAIRLKPDYPEAYNSLGLTFCSLNLPSQAQDCLQQAIDLRGNYAEAYNNLGIVQIKLKQADEAISSFQRAVQLDPDNPNLLNNLGLSYLGLERYEEAEECFDQAVRLDPKNAEANYNLGCTLKELNRPAEAITYFQQTLALKPDYLAAYEKLSAALFTTNRYTDAENYLRQVIAIDPEFADAHRNLGRVLKRMHRTEEAEAAYLRAIEASDPDCADDYLYGLGILHLLRGQYAKGWEYYDLRRTLFNYPEPEFPYWQGEDLTGRTILLFCEQGFGDTLQFIRYAKQVASVAKKTDIRVQPPLQHLLAASLPDCTVYSGAVRPSEHYDFACSLHSLPMIFQSTEATIPEKKSYLSPSPKLVGKWRRFLDKASDKNLYRVGIVWAGNPKHHNDHNRSIPFRLVKKLLDFTPLTWVNLQTGDRSQDLHQTYRIVLDATKELRDYNETAAIVQNLDLVITVDSSVAHLAGAMGKPVWILLPFAPDWRWQLDREDSPWYDSVRLFRQKKVGNWMDVLLRVRAELQKLVSNKK